MYCILRAYGDFADRCRISYLLVFIMYLSMYLSMYDRSINTKRYLK